MASTWLEVALNGPWARARQPRIPITVAEIVAEGIACARAGAAIVHVHAYDEDTGRQRDDAAIYAAIIEGIRDQVDAIVYPTIPFAGSTDAPESAAEVRFAAVEALAKRGLLEWAVVDPGTVNIAHRDDIARDREGFVYANPESHVRWGLELAAAHGFHPGYAIYEPGFLRLGAALAARYPTAPQAIYRFMFSDGFTFGYPPEPYALESYLELLAREAPGAPWMVAGLAVEIGPLMETTLARGGHVRVGLEDAPLSTDRSNLQLVEAAARAVHDAGGDLATAAEVRDRLSGRD